MAITGAVALRPIGAETRVTASQPRRAIGKDGGGEQPTPRTAGTPPDERARKEEPRPLRPVQLPDFVRQAIVFRHDRELNRIIVQVVDAETREVIRSIPPEQVVATLKSIRQAQGILLDEEA